MPASVKTPSTSVAKSRMRFRLEPKDFRGRFRAVIRLYQLPVRVDARAILLAQEDSSKQKIEEASGGRYGMSNAPHESDQGILPGGQWGEMRCEPIMRQDRVGWPSCGPACLSRGNRLDRGLSAALTDNGLGKFIPGALTAVRDVTNAPKFTQR